MKIHTYTCSKHAPVKVPQLTLREKANILAYLKKRQVPGAVKYIMEVAGLKLDEAKNFVQHINDKYGKCHVCKIDDMTGENQTCPNCRRFTLNWNIERLTIYNQTKH